jgi:DEAD/DEAH box helicase domain-containing protein
VDYYTDADRSAKVEVLDRFDAEEGDMGRGHGEVQVTSLVTIFKKIRLHTHETIGQGPIDLPQVDVHTTSYWTVVRPEVAATYPRLHLQAGLHGLAHALRHVASVHVMCDPRDLGVATQVRSPHTGGPTVFLYDAFPGGVGLSGRLYELHPELLAGAAELIDGCGCAAGCPSCVGAMVELGAEAKACAPRLAHGQAGPVHRAELPALTA